MMASNALDPALHPGGIAVVNRVAAFPQPGVLASPGELQALNDVAKSSPTQRALRIVGALAPNSPITALMHAGGLIGGLATGGVGTAGSLGTMATGLAAKAAANRLTASAVDSLGNLIRSGGVAAPRSAPSVFPRVASPLSAAFVNSLFAPDPQPSPAGLGAVFAQ